MPDAVQRILTVVFSSTFRMPPTVIVIGCLSYDSTFVALPLIDGFSGAVKEKCEIRWEKQRKFER